MTAKLYRIDPMGKPRMTQRDKWKKRDVVLHYNAFKDMVRLAGIKEIPDVPRIVFYIPMPASWPEKKKAEFDGQPHRAKPDIDNLQKALFDAVYHKHAETDDSHIWCGWKEKRWSRQGAILIEDLTQRKGWQAP